MATTNPFDLLGDDDIEDPALFIAAQEQKAAAAGTKKSPTAAPAAAAKPSKLPTKPLPPSQAVDFCSPVSVMEDDRGPLQVTPGCSEQIVSSISSVGDSGMCGSKKWYYSTFSIQSGVIIYTYEDCEEFKPVAINSFKV